jgi:prephenate dehydrogenase|tara:strand:- start:1630 stop:2499 length:870 start_codon:yes stop_codon:yes gene_type:complete
VKVTIIGAAGKMGTWFTRYFVEKGNEVSIFDLNYNKAEEIAKEFNIKNTVNMISVIKEADIILVAVPIDITSEIVARVSKSVKKGAIIVEIASFKEKIINALKKIMENNVVFLSIHPMFGPGAKNLSNSKIIVVTEMDSEKEVKIAKKVFPEANVVSSSAKEHDEAMAIILSFTHFINVTYASILSSKDLKSLRRLSGTTFNLQLTLTESILHDDPEFLTALLLENKYAEKEIRQLVNVTNSLGNLALQNEQEKLKSTLRTLRRTMEKDKGYPTAYQKMYKMIDILLEK